MLLTATWLLPIALMPRAWRDDSFPPAPPAPVGPVKTPSNGGKSESETPTPVPSKLSQSPPHVNPTASPNPPASLTPANTMPGAWPTTPGDSEEDAEAEGQWRGKRTIRTSFYQTFASFVSRKAKILPGNNSTSEGTIPGGVHVGEAPMATPSPSAASTLGFVASRVCSRLLRLMSPHQQATGLLPVLSPLGVQEQKQ